ncbi:MAG: ribosomal RNA small subunit methyltransferase A [Spirochaetaceae bacterium]|nr:ribosomal RNA small subunit methyltransferase A [Spirochaetaceae bacterium]HPG25309.1 16S rRNA (adenine(1518)-N(6)/adenine(1519)-N(6))-dimethyltransferase RsmA [Myxococcota bacterium]
MNEGELRALLARHGLRLTRELGQNFLVDEALASELARRAGASEGDFVIEVGTGLGVLTRALAARVARVRTVEIDAGLVRALEQEGLLPANVELVHGDALEIDWRAWIAEAQGASVRVIANLPYSVATPLLRRLLDLRDGLADWSVMIQREVARRLVARTGESDYGSLSVLHALAADVDTIATLPPGRFFPRPKVESSFVRVWPRARSPLGPGELERVERVVRAAFSQRRKRLTNGLDRLAERRWPGLERGARREWLEALLGEVGLDPGLRPERIEPEAWLALARRLDAGDDPAPASGGLPASASEEGGDE